MKNLINKQQQFEWWNDNKYIDKNKAELKAIKRARKIEWMIKNLSTHKSTY